MEISATPMGPAAAFFAMVIITSHHVPKPVQVSSKSL